MALTRSSSTRIENCVKCNEKLFSRSSLKCCQCLKLYHPDCEKISAEDFEKFKNLSSAVRGFLWCCESCQNNFYTEDKLNIIQEINNLKINFDKKIGDIEKIVLKNTEFQQTQLKEINVNLNKEQLYPKIEETIDDQFKKIQENIKVQNSSITTQMTSYADILNKNLKNNSNTEKAITTLSKGMETLQTKINKEKEKKLKEDKANNLCIFNIPESDQTDETLQKSSDKVKVKSIIDPQSQIPAGKIEYIRRINEKSHGKTRPIIIRFKCLETRMKILKLRNLTYSQLGNETKIYIHPDRTKQQQEENKLLVQKLREIKSKGENAFIRNGKIIINQSFRKSSQVAWDDEN